MSKNPQMDAARMEKSKQRVLACGFKMFAEHGIESVTMPDLAKASDIDRSSIYRYFPTKADLVIAISSNVWENITTQNYERMGVETRTAAQRYEFWLDSFLVLYREHGDLLRFNQFFNVYVANEKVSEEQMEPFNRVIITLEARFHDTYELAKQDGTLRTDIPENGIFSATLHLMLAAVTRYAVGLVYQGGTEPEKELERLKKMLMREFVIQTNE